MSAPRWARWLLRMAAASHEVEEVTGDLEEAHRARLARLGRLRADLLTALEALDMAFALLRARWSRWSDQRKAAASTPPRTASEGRPTSVRSPPPLLGISLLDFKLGVRMLVRYPGLTVLGGLAMAFAVFTGAGAFEILRQAAYPALPLPEGGRIVGIRLQDASTGRGESRVAFDLERWREVEAVQDLGAFREVRRNLITGEGPGEPMEVAIVDAAAFRVAGVPPLLGRTLDDADQRLGAEAVVAIGHDIWQRNFGGDPDVVGRVVRLGSTPTTIVGVMPEGFGFPVAHRLWMPRPHGSSAYAPREGPNLRVFGRLAAEATLEEAQTELTAVGLRIAADQPTTHQHLRPRVMPYARSILGGSLTGTQVSALFFGSNVPMILFVILVCGNVALLMFARAAAREEELVIRSALGAGRSRIVGQLFAEALVLSGLATVLGLVALEVTLDEVFGVIQAEVFEGDPLPFWLHSGVSAVTASYACLLALLAAAVAGAMPAFKVTRGIGERLKRASAGGGGFRFGGLWTAIIVAQISVTVLCPIVTFELWREADSVATPDIGIEGDDFLSARIELDDEMAVGPFQAPRTAGDSGDRYVGVVRDLEERLELESELAGVTFTERLPRLYHPNRHIEIDGPSAEPLDARGHHIGSVSVPVDYLPLLDAELVEGRAFAAGDVGTRVVIVNESFTRAILGGRNPIGRRVRYAAGDLGAEAEEEPGPWLEIIGVVEDLGTQSGFGPQGMYHPARPGELLPVHVVVKALGDARPFIPTLRRIAAEVDPALRLEQVRTLEEVTHDEARFYGFWVSLLIVTTSLALLLSLGGIYAVMSFTVVQRTREIGIRMALGSRRLRVVTAVLRRPFVQVAIGIGWGVVAIGGFYDLLGSEVTWGLVAWVASYTLAMVGVCALACVMPLRRALAVEPSEALRAEG